MSKNANILVLDIETFPIVAYVWGLFDINIPVNMIESDWSVACYSAKWLNNNNTVYGPHDKVMYDTVEKKSEKSMLKGIHKLMNEADIVIGQNSKQFDVKKLNARFIHHGFTPASPYKQHDTKLMMGRYFAFTSKKLEYASDELNVKYKKLTHSQFPGFSLWKECMANNPKAWKEMITYNVHDVLATEELFNILAPWDKSVRFDIYSDSTEQTCSCGGIKFQKRGTFKQLNGTFQKIQCQTCGKWSSYRTSLLSKEKKVSLLK